MCSALYTILSSTLYTILILKFYFSLRMVYQAGVFLYIWDREIILRTPPHLRSKIWIDRLSCFSSHSRLLIFLVLVISLFLAKSKLLPLGYTFFFPIPYMSLHCVPFFMKEHFILKLNGDLEVLVWNFIELIQE